MPRIRISAKFLPALFAVIAAAALFGWWALATQFLRASLEVFASAERGQGSEVRWESLTVDGFPLRARATVTGISVVRRDGSAWSGAGVTVEAPLWAVQKLAFRLSGRHQLRLPPGWQAATATAEGGDGAVRLGGDAGFTEARLALTDVQVQPARTDAAPATLARLEATVGAPGTAPTQHTDLGLMVSVDASKVHLPLAGALPLGPSLESLSVSARVMGAPPRLTPAALAVWSRDGGTVELDTASLHWGPLALGAEGTLTLDRDLQPQCALTTEITGFGAAIDTLVAAGWVKPNQGQTAKAVLTGLTPRREGEPPPANPTAKLPISIQHRFVHVGPFRLVPLPTVVWGDPPAG